MESQELFPGTWERLVLDVVQAGVDCSGRSASYKKTYRLALCSLRLLILVIELCRPLQIGCLLSPLFWCCDFEPVYGYGLLSATSAIEGRKP